jgi:hypothetical protein
MPVAEFHEGLPVTELTVMTKAELAWMRAEEGDTVVQRDGRHWHTTFPGFFQPIHLLARFRAAEIRRPRQRAAELLQIRLAGLAAARDGGRPVVDEADRL